MQSLACLAIGCALSFAQGSSTLTVSGDVSSALHLTADDLAKMPRTTATVEDSDGSKVLYEGVALGEVLKRAGAPTGKDLRGKALAGYVIAKAHDGYQVVFSMGETDAGLTGNLILLADKRDGKALFGYQGPFRLVVPSDKAGARSVRMLEELQVVRLIK